MTYAPVLMMETFRRRRLVPFVHVIFLISYTALFLMFLYPETPPIGGYMFLASGIALPLALSPGILGNDISSGRFRVLATEPVTLSAYYGWRVAGLVAQGSIQIATVSGVAFLLYVLTGRGDTENLEYWAFATLALYISVAAFSATLSVVAKAEANSLIAFLLLPMFFLLFVASKSVDDPFWVAVCDAVFTVGKYVLPPAALLFKAAHDGPPRGGMLGCGLHALGLTLVYGVIGVFLLERRQYKPQRS